MTLTTRPNLWLSWTKQRIISSRIANCEVLSRSQSTKSYSGRKMLTINRWWASAITSGNYMGIRRLRQHSPSPKAISAHISPKWQTISYQKAQPRRFTQMSGRKITKSPSAPTHLLSMRSSKSWQRSNQNFSQHFNWDSKRLSSCISLT